MIRRDDFRVALGEPDAGFNAAVDEALRRVREGEVRRVGRRGLKVSLAIAAVVLALTGVALAVAARLNLFEKFSGFDRRLAWIAGESGLVEEAALSLRTSELGATGLRVGDAY